MHSHYWSSSLMYSDATFVSFWKDRLSEKRDILFVIGKGFDPRMCNSYNQILSFQGTGRRDCLLFPCGGYTDISNKELVKRTTENVRNIHEIAKKYDFDRAIVTDLSDRLSTEEREISNTLLTLKDISKYSDIIIDISSLPRRIFFAIISSLLDKQKTDKSFVKNIHVVVSDSPGIDAAITSEVSQDPEPMFGFSKVIQARSLLGLPTIWLPILGENREHHLHKIHEYVKPDDIYPILPFPSRDLRRADKLIVEYHKTLFEAFSIDSGNVILASDTNPFDLYRSIVYTATYLEETLRALKGCKIILSPLSSKLSTVGAILAALHLKWNDSNIGVVYVNTVRYDMDFIDHEWDSEQCHLTSLWLGGEPYEK